MFGKAQTDVVVSVEEAQEELDAVSKFLSAKGAEMGISKQSIILLNEYFRPLFDQLAICRRSLAELKETAKDVKKQPVPKAAARKKLKEAFAAARVACCGGCGQRAGNGTSGTSKTGDRRPRPLSEGRFRVTGGLLCG